MYIYGTHMHSQSDIHNFINLTCGFPLLLSKKNAQKHHHRKKKCVINLTQFKVLPLTFRTGNSKRLTKYIQITHSNYEHRENPKPCDQVSLVNSQFIN